MQAQLEAADTSASIGGRYRVEGELGRGGMAHVYRVVDERSGEQLALKLLRGDPGATARAMFEREYNALVQLAHPRIVRAFEYGLHGSNPYYTMELLAGSDARETAKRSLGVRDICLLLRDAASALALIHSRRMVHRDIGPRNLWVSPELRGTLIDFGTLVAMGPQTRIAGTPPFLPPEAFHRQPLDARCDMYALGGLAYFLLTGRNAYPAREVAELPAMWRRRPKRPAQLRPEVPQALSDLVMALLSQDARGRPGSAAEVFERLSAIAELPVEDERRAAQAFLTHPKLVGRNEASAFLRKRLARATSGQGAAVSIVARSGLGRSRMLSSFVLEAKITGAAAIAVDATAVDASAFGLAGTLVERLLELLPMTAATATAIGVAKVLGHLSPAVHTLLGAPALAEQPPFDRAIKLRSALVALFRAASRTQAIAIAVDDVHRADAASLGVLGKLALLADDHPLLLVTTCDADALLHAPPGLERLVQDRHRLHLPPLDAGHTRELLESLFGAVAGLDDAAGWLHGVSQGSPQSCMQYAQYLVDEGIARHAGGEWRLPKDLRDHGLPGTLDALLENRIARLGDDARTLALGLALARDESRSVWQPEAHVRVEDLPKLLDGEQPARAFLALDELLRTGIVQQRDSWYVMAEQGVTAALLRLASEDAKRRAHARLAEVLGQASYPATALSIRHLLLAGEPERARERFLAFAESYLGRAHDWGSMRVAVTAECGLRALEHWQRHGGSPREGIMLRRTLLITCSVFDWSMAWLSAAQIAQLRADTGLFHWDGLDPSLPEPQRAIECLKRAHQEYEHKPEAERGLPPIDAVRELSACAMTLIGAFVNSHDVAGVRSLPAILGPLRSLSPNVAIIHELCELAVDRVLGRELGQRLGGAAERLLGAGDLPFVLRIGGGVITAHFQAVEDARRGRKSALDRIASLVPLVEEEAFLVVHGRWLAHAFRGETDAARRHRRQVEVISEDDVWRRRALLFVEAQLHALTGDLPGLSRASDAIAELAAKFPGWLPWAHFARGALHRLRGELEPAEQELRAALALARPGEHRAYVLAAPALAEVLLLRGEHAGAADAAEAVAQAVLALSLDRSAAVAAQRVKALAESRRGEHAAAAACMERAFALARELEYGGLPLAQLYEAQARIALAAGAAALFHEALAHLASLLHDAEAPALWSAYEALLNESQGALPAADGERPSVKTPLRPASEDLHAISTVTFSEIQTRFLSLPQRSDRSRQALELLLEACSAATGHLLLFDEGGLFFAASAGAAIGAERLIASVQRLIDSDIETRGATVVMPADAGPTALVVSDGQTQFVPILLTDHADGTDLLTGVALIAAAAGPVRYPRRELIDAISRCLRITSDSLAQPLPEF